MKYFCRSVTSLACLILVAGCDQPLTPKPAATKVTRDPITADVNRLEAGIRIAAANKRIDELERQVGALQATPEKLDLELLTNRVEALEARAGGDASSPGKPSGKTTLEPQNSRSGLKPDGSGQAKQQTSKPSLL